MELRTSQHFDIANSKEVDRELLVLKLNSNEIELIRGSEDQRSF